MTDLSPNRSTPGATFARLAGLAALLTGLTAVPAPAQQQGEATETYRLRGAGVAVHNVAGRVELVRGEGDDVRVEVTRRGPDSGRLSVATGVVDSRQALRVLYPEGEDRVVYPERGEEDDVPGFLRWLGLDFDSEIDTGSGSVRLDGVSGSRVGVDTGSGGIEVRRG